jgi:pyrroloquinoline-quinone synthase
VDFWTEIEAVRERHDVLTHSFYQRWSAGELTREELAVYSGEYRHAVQALATASAHAAAVAEPELRPGLEAHAREEASHVALWDGFAAAVGGDLEREPAPETVACARDWAGEERPFLHSLVALYAIESAQPAISETKRAGLLEHYGFEDGPGTAYFELHAKLDHEHAAAARGLIEPRLAGADREALIAEAERVLKANWELLDGVERLNGRG